MLFHVNGIDCELSDTLNLTKKGWKQYSALLQSNCKDFKLWRAQSDFDFSFVPLSNQITSWVRSYDNAEIVDPIKQHFRVKQEGLPNFLGAKITLDSQLNLDQWEVELKDYWDQQLV